MGPGARVSVNPSTASSDDGIRILRATLCRFDSTEPRTHIRYGFVFQGNVVSNNVSQPVQNIQINDLLQFMVKQEASDLHLKPMRPPLVRLNGRLLPLKSDPIPPELLNQMLMEMMPDRMVSQLEETLAVDFGYSMRGISRFRASIFYQRGNLSAVFRRVPFQFPTLDDWGLPPIIKEL